jgi:hypothetical protein
MTQSRRWCFAKPATWLALAASVILLLGIGLLLRPDATGPMSGEQFVQSVLDLKTSGQISLGKMSSDPEELRTWLARQRSPSAFDLPPSLEKLGAMGCQTFTVHGHKVLSLSKISVIVCISVRNALRSLMTSISLSDVYFSLSSDGVPFAAICPSSITIT